MWQFLAKGHRLDMLDNTSKQRAISLESYQSVPLPDL